MPIILKIPSYPEEDLLKMYKQPFSNSFFFLSEYRNQKLIDSIY